MPSTGLRALLVGALLSVPCAALADPLNLAPDTVQVASNPSPLGGGFIEFLFNGVREQAPPPAAAPQYPQPPQASYDPNPYGGEPMQAPAAAPQPVDPAHYPIDPRYQKQVVPYIGPEKPGTIIIDTRLKYLFLVRDDGTAIRYGIGVGRPGFLWAGTKQVTRKREWPDWTPPPEMIQRQPYLPRHMEGGPDNPLGARALYLGSSLYRIHGSNEPWTIGHNVSSGCIRMRNEDVIDLYDRVKVGTKVVVL